MLWSEFYKDKRDVPGVGLCGIRPMLFTVGVFIDLDENGYDHRYCFKHYADAVLALKRWDGRGELPGPWIAKKGIGEVEKLLSRPER